MNIYLCSTLRHFLFAILRSLKEVDQESRIIVVTDQQGLESDSFDLSVLPSTITVKFIGRKKLLKEIYSGGVGLIHNFFAVANCHSEFFKKRTVNKLYESKILVDSQVKGNIRLFLFNDRNRLSRLMRLAFPFYEVIEDGLSNYTGTELSFADRFLSNKKIRRYIGDDRRCKVIHLLTPELAPSQIVNKVQSIDFIDPNNVNRYLYSIFKLDNSNVVIPDVIIATQPISIAGMNDSGKDIDVYREMVEHLESKNFTYAFKVHPRENEGKYKSAFPVSKFIKSKIPLELLVFASSSSPVVLSVYSSAGMGFEGFCRRMTLITDDEAEVQAEIYNQWKESLLDLNKRLEAMF
ncbi:glycosyltransferase family 52 [Vibrio lentus]|uniref:glycosyltransferase family 52 n=1 Tax=Vibrio lentus TaxID=136468 RepID=UPI000C83F824|nr:glycosyltransferase family 52 [Vibrio lentus]PMG80851.1 hypothetical protein BCU86_00420 [Vibrio lentus]PMH91286.1 hypothetical protein BCU56_02000 [Vibrio lentus]PMJ00250.1 hypothetical protein BCU32_11850 [Vibrio lentus]PMJ11049.1 hypothetical protein BCU29_01710 [Vibrio lentus]